MPFYRRHISSQPQKRFNKKRLLRGILFFAAGALVIGFFIFTLIAVWISRDLPNPNVLSTRDIPQSTQMFDRTGTHLLYEIHGDENRTLVKIEEIPNFMKWATVAIEDKNFYEHNGIYWKGVIRAVFTNLLHGKLQQGASTLTQQLVKNALLSNERTFSRKLKEFLLALQIERVYTKDQILQLYLNEIPYGSTIYGVESASETYFGKHASELTLDEAALLASIPQATDLYSPYGSGLHGDNRVRLVARQHTVIDLMQQQGYINKADADAAKQIDTLKKIKPKNMGLVDAPHFIMYVRSLLIDAYGQKKVEQGGLKVITTLDWDKQQAAQDAVKKGVEARGKTYKFTNAALISLDPKNGQILAMVGSHDYFDTENDGEVNVTLRPRQPGSSFKPIVYAVGFMRGYLPQTQLWDVNTIFKTDLKDYAPRDYDLKERGPVTVRQGLQWSLNTPAVKMLYLVGVGRVLDFAESLGYTTVGDRSRFGLSLVLGGAEVKPIEHASAYAAFATEGIRYPTAAILKVTDPTGQTLEEWKPSAGDRVMDPQISRLVSDVLSDNASRAAIFGLQNSLILPDRPVAAKTGTTNDNRDAWTAGYTPNLVAVVWVGNNNNAAMKAGADGSIVAAPIWQAYMKQALKSMAIEKFTPPDPPTVTTPALLGSAFMHPVKVNRLTNKLATELTPPELIEERIAYEPHEILQYIDKDDPTGPPPSNPVSDPQYANWEAAVQDWIARTHWNTTTTIPTEYDTGYSDETRPQFTVLEPTTSQVLHTRTVPVRIQVASTRLITRFDIYLNATLIDSVASSPTFDIAIPNDTLAGAYDLKIVAVDDVGSRGEVIVPVDFEAPAAETPHIKITSPLSGALWSRKNFPQTLTAQIIEPERYSALRISFIGTDKKEILVASDPPTGPVFSSKITLGPPIGMYRLVITGVPVSGSKTEADIASTAIQITE